MVNAEAIRQWLIGDGYDPGKIVVIRNGIDLARFSRLRTGAGVRHELGVSGEAPVIAMLARVNRLKGIEHFLEAAASVAAGVPEGPAIGKGLRAALAAKLDADIGGREEELARALRAARGDE